MQVNSSQGETQIATLLAGVTTNIMNHIANLEEELKATRQIAAELQSKLKSSEERVHSLEKDVEDLTVELGQSQHKK